MRIGRAVTGARALVWTALGAPGAAIAASLDGAALGLMWVVPFVGMLLSIAVLPLVALRLWHHHYGKIAVAWSALTLVPLATLFGPAAAFDVAAHTLLLEYLPFIIFIGTLYVVAGGIYVRGNLHGSPTLNTGILAIGAVLASLMGTTGAAMLLIRPLIRANDNRHYRVHTIVFFIFIVANVGGSLTPLGDPPLFLGFLKGVSFFWTLEHMLVPMLFVVAILLVLYFAIDTLLYKKDLERGLERDPTPDAPLRIEGKINFGLLLLVIIAVLLSGLAKTGIEVNVFGQHLVLEGMMRDAAFLVIAGISLAVTKASVRKANEFGWGPVAEVAKLFFGIFLTMAPVLLMLKSGIAGAFAPLVQLVTDPAGQPVNSMYFWLTGSLSSFLDNAPTYLVFFNLAGGDPQTLMTTMAPTLLAISAGAVFMGANTYIGNAPNFMVKAIAEERGIPMPGFFGYMLWSCVILVPIFIVMTFIFFQS